MQLNIIHDKIRIGDNNLSYRLRTAGDHCLLFIHGLGCSKDSFKYAFNGNFFSEYTLLAPDLLGHGDSSKPDNFSYTLKKQSDLIFELVQKINPEFIHIVAHSMGSVVALLLMEKLNNVNSFFCLEGNLIPEDCHISRKVSSLDEKEFINKIYPMAPLTFSCKDLPQEKSASPLAFYRSAKSLVHWSFHGNLLEKFQNLSIQKTYFYGEENKESAVLQKLEKKDIVQINRCGHFMMLDNPEDTYNGISRRLDTLPL